MYYFRFNNSEPYYASPVKVTRTGQDSWTVESTPPHLVRLLGTGKKGVELDLGLYTLPLKLTLTVTKAYVPYTYAQKSNALEDIFTWSPRGDRIGLAASDPDGDHTIQVIDLQTGSVLGEYGRGVFASAPRGLAWANRGEMLAFSANGHYGQETVFVLNLRTGSLVEIGLGFTPRWAPDDSRLIFISEDGISIFDLARGAVVTVPRNSPDLIR
jgi:DNA-binding beta-propeller fold protein YncE